MISTVKNVKLTVKYLKFFWYQIFFHLNLELLDFFIGFRIMFTSGVFLLSKLYSIAYLKDIFWASVVSCSSFLEETVSRHKTYVCLVAVRR